MPDSEIIRKHERLAIAVKLGASFLAESKRERAERLSHKIADGIQSKECFVAGFFDHIDLHLMTQCTVSAQRYEFERIALERELGVSPNRLILRLAEESTAFALSLSLLHR